MANIIVDAEWLASQMGDMAHEFIECMRIVQDIIDKPEDNDDCKISSLQAPFSDHE